MGIGVNFVCKCCQYDTGLIMLAQGENHSVHAIAEKYIYTYSQEMDLKMLPRRIDMYKMINLYLKSRPEREATYYYHGCVCYGCRRTYEMLDIFQEKEEEVFVGDKKLMYNQANTFHEVFHPSPSKWSSLLGDEPLCLFCEQKVVKVTEELLQQGIPCPKCETGKLEIGNEFQLWD